MYGKYGEKSARGEEAEIGRSRCYTPVMEFTIRGISFGEEVELTWRDGEIFGHEERKRLLESKAKSLEGFPVGRGPGGWPISEANHLQEAYAAYTLMRWGIFQEVLAETGDIPEPPELSPGWVS